MQAEVFCFQVLLSVMFQSSVDHEMPFSIISHCWDWKNASNYFSLLKKSCSCRQGPTKKKKNVSHFRTQGPKIHLVQNLRAFLCVRQCYGDSTHLKANDSLEMKFCALINFIY